LVGAALPDVAGTGESLRVVFDDRRAGGAGVPCDRHNIEDFRVLHCLFQDFEQKHRREQWRTQEFFSALHHPHRTHDSRSGSQDHHPIQKLGAENHMLQLNI